MSSQPLPGAGFSRHSVSVAGAVIRPDGRLLAIRRRDNDAWQPPGGVLELAESPQDGVRREVAEETGLIVEPEALTGVYKNMTAGVIALVFRCHVVGGRVRSTDEAVEVAWLTCHEVSGLMSEAFAIRLLDAVGFQGAPAVRVHDGVRLLA
ncbi:NUDIX hydrolase [Nonomuraea sp. NPDC049400]|uniref:NUDIX hydrolase n=1 Tax=Nonomuraea sp. NPDC049400 TaxID=3364352 RepID=UPI0037B5C23F